MKRILPILLIAALALGGWFWWQQRDASSSGDITLYGNVDIRQVALAFDGSGRIAELRVQEGDRVKAGAVIARLDTHTLELQAKAQEAVVEAERQTLLELRAGARPEEIAQAQARVASAKASAELANLQRDRAARLLTSRAVSQQDLDRASTEAKAANAAVDQDIAALDLLLAGARPEEIAAAAARLQAAEAQLELLRYQVTLGELRAPADAVIRSRLREPGDMATPQSPVYALALTDPKWVRVYVREADLGRIKPGMAAQVLTDSHPEPVAGQVGYISSVAEFTPKSVQTEELRTSLVYEVHVTVDDPTDSLRLGQPVTVKLTDGHAP